MNLSKVTTKKTTQTIEVDKETFEGIKSDDIKFIILPDALNFSVKKKGTIKYKSKKKRVKFRWIKWLKLDELMKYEYVGAGFDSLKEVKEYLKEEKSGFQSNSNLTVVCLY